MKESSLKTTSMDMESMCGKMSANTTKESGWMANIMALECLLKMEA